MSHIQKTNSVTSPMTCGNGVKHMRFLGFSLYLQTPNCHTLKQMAMKCSPQINPRHTPRNVTLFLAQYVFMKLLSEPIT
jgi:hypothetical protein